MAPYTREEHYHFSMLNQRWVLQVKSDFEGTLTTDAADGDLVLRFNERQAGVDRFFSAVEVVESYNEGPLSLDP